MDISKKEKNNNKQNKLQVCMKIAFLLCSNQKSKKKIVARVIFKVCSSWEKFTVIFIIESRTINLSVNICMFLCTYFD